MRQQGMNATFVPLGLLSVHVTFVCVINVEGSGKIQQTTVYIRLLLIYIKYIYYQVSPTFTISQNTHGGL